MRTTVIAKLSLAALLLPTLAACTSRSSSRGGVGASGHVLIEGIGSDSPTPTFALVAAPNVISTGDGDTMYMWLYGTSSATVQYPGPTLIVNQGAVVTITLSSQLPVATSIVFPGLDVTATGGGGTAAGLLTREVLPNAGGSVAYTFTASRPGTFLYHSGTRPDLQVEMGLAGTIIVRPSTFAPGTTCTTGTAPCRKAYGDASTAYDREYLFFLTDADPLIHQAVAFASTAEIAAGFPSIDTTKRHAVDWFINGRNFPDTVTDAHVAWLPTQPYNAFPRMHPGEKILMRFVGAGADLHPFHTHGQNHLVVARDARVLGTNVLSAADPVADLAVSDYTTTAVPGETVDAIWGPWTGAKLGWDVYGTADINPHTCTADATGFDPSTHEYCADHYKKLPVTLPPETYTTFGQFFGGTPYIGIPGPLPPLNPDGTVHVQQDPQAGLAYMWHSHSERELTTNDIFIGGMATMALVLPMSATIP